MKKNIIAILITCLLLCGCRNADGKLEETGTGETTAPIDNFLSTEVIWQDNSKDLYSAAGMPVSLAFENPKNAISGGNSMAALGSLHAAALKKHFYIDGDTVNCWDEMVYIASDGEKKTVRITEGYEKQVNGIGSVWGNEHYVVFCEEAAKDAPQGFKYLIRELDEDMQEIGTIEPGFLEEDYVTPISLLMDKDGNVHLIYSKKGEVEYTYSYHYCIVSGAGELLWQIDLDNEEAVSLISPGDGQAALQKGKEIIQIDSKTGEETRLNNMENLGSCFTYWDEANILYADKEGVYLRNELDGTTKTLYLWKNHGIRAAKAEAVLRSGDEGISVLYSDSKGYAFVHLEPTVEEVEVKNITLAVDSWNKSAYSMAVADFNRKYPAYHISLTEYDYNDQKLLTEMTAGNGPVIIDTALVDFEDMTEYWEPLDDVFDQMGMTEELLPEVIDMGKVNGSLYGIATNFCIRTVITAMESPKGWNYEEFINCIEEKKDSLKSIFNGNSMDDGTAFVIKYFMHGLNDNYCIDAGSGTTRFDTEDFRRIIRWGKQYQGTNGGYEDLLDGTMLCFDAEIRKPQDIPYLRVLMGDDVNYIGYPCEDGQGHYLAASSMLAVRDNATEEEKRIAHSFIKLMLSYEQQIDAAESDDFNMSVRKDVLEYQLENISTDTSCHIFGLPNVILEEEQFDYDKDRKTLFELIEKAKPYSSLPVEMQEVIVEELVSYFYEQMDEDKIISNLKGRVELYLGERMAQ